jgi:hypothetical protein
VVASRGGRPGAAHRRASARRCGDRGRQCQKARGTAAPVSSGRQCQRLPRRVSFVGKRQCCPSRSAAPPSSLSAPDPNERNAVTDDLVIANRDHRPASARYGGHPEHCYEDSPVACSQQIELRAHDRAAAPDPQPGPAWRSTRALRGRKSQLSAPSCPAKTRR